jgi:hypothetical protein
MGILPSDFLKENGKRPALDGFAGPHASSGPADIAIRHVPNRVDLKEATVSILRIPADRATAVCALVTRFAAAG